MVGGHHASKTTLKADVAKFAVQLFDKAENELMERCEIYKKKAQEC